MKFFSLDWFKSLIDRNEPVVEKEVVEQKEVVKHVPVNPLVDESPVKSMKLVNNVLTVYLRQSGEVLIKQEADVNDFNRVANAASEQEVRKIFANVEGLRQMIKQEAIEKDLVKEYEQMEKVLTSLEILDQFSDFEVEGSSIILKDTGRTLPDVLVQEFREIIDSYAGYSIQQIEELLPKNEKYKSLKYFFMWACLNPRAEVADQLYAFLKKNSFRITKQGFFVALRNVVTIPNDDPESRDLVDFVSNAYNKIKTVWKKSPAAFIVDKNKETGKYEFYNYAGEGFYKGLGTLKELYANLPSMKGNRFTDAHTRTFDIRIGVPVNMPPEECSWSTVDCAEAGLHFTADEIHYVGCGDTSVLALINPMKVVGIGEFKGRCYEYLPIMTVPREEATKILHDVDFDTLQLDEDYAIRELESLAEKAKAGFVAETSKHEFNLPGMSTLQISRIVTSLEDMKSVLSKRVSSITK